MVYVPWLDKMTHFSFYWTSQSLLDFLKTHSKARIFLDSPGDTKTFILWLHLDEEAEVVAVATHPEYQRKGLMKTLWKQWVEHLKCLGVKVIFLDVHSKNQAALSFYSQMGLKPVGLRKTYYRDGADALILKGTLDEYHKE